VIGFIGTAEAVPFYKAGHFQVLGVFLGRLQGVVDLIGFVGGTEVVPLFQGEFPEGLAEG